MPKVDADDHGISLLYVEDVQDSRDMLTDIMRYRYPDVRLLVADNGATGFELFTLNQPDIVITDINMPVTDGLSMAAKIKLLSPSTEIIVLTAYNESEHLLRAIEIGVSHFIKKPIETETFFKVFNKVLAQVRSEREIVRQNKVIRQLNSELVKKTAELEQANMDLESYDYTVAHDLRSPIVAIRDFSRKFLDKHSDTPDCEGKQWIQAINRESIRMDGLVDALLRFSIKSRKYPEKKMTDLCVMVHEICGSLLDKEPLRQVTFFVEEGVNGYCDPELMRIVLKNLLGNAWKFSSGKDNVKIEFGTINKEDDLVYFVRDNGSGFDKDDSAKIFVPFQRLQCDGQIEGFGIGLATSLRIIRRHGGKIWAEAEKGEGATFYFTI